MAMNRLRHLPKGRGGLAYLRNTMSMYRARRKRTVTLPHPNALMIEVTNHCQLHCITCAREYSLGKEMDKGHMDLELAKKLIDENHVYLDRICLTGLGEPLVYPDLVKLIDYIYSKNKGIAIMISTNAQHPNASKILASVADKIATLQVSIDGCGDVFEEIRVNADYGVFLKSLQDLTGMMSKHRFDIRLNMVVFGKNYHQMADVVAVTKSLGLSELSLTPINLVASDWDLSHYDLYRTDPYRSELDKALHLAKREGVSVAYLDIAEFTGFETCRFPWDDFYITWDGFLVPCCAKPFPKEKHFGNVFAEGLMNCLNSSEFADFRRRANENVTPAFCERCHVVTGSRSGLVRPSSGYDH
jgi:radical SAM protein with 4Fe4S-binding SPASM domain